MLKDLTEDLGKEAAVQLHLLWIIFALTDMNQENIGLNGDGNLALVGVSFSGLRYSSCREMFETDKTTNHSRLSQLGECSPSERIELGRNAMKKWDLEDNIELAKKNFDEVKQKLGEKVTYWNRTDSVLDKYMKNVDFHIQRLKGVFEEAQ